jgi:hypothetical protein
VRGLFSIADACGDEWGRRAREAATFLLEKERVEHPKLVIIRHGLLIFEVLEIDQIKSTQFNIELKRLDLSDALWNRYRGASGGDYAHSLRMDEQAALLSLVGIESEYCRPPGGRRAKKFRGYKRTAFEEAARKYNVVMPSEAERRRSLLRLVPPSE